MNKITLGLLIGVAVGILYAPDKGSITRKKLREVLDDLSDKLSEGEGAFTPKDNTSGIPVSTVPEINQVF